MLIYLYMADTLKERFESLKTLVLCEVPIDKDPLHVPFHYVLGDFSIASLPHFESFLSVIDAINPHGEVSIGVGFDTYCQNIKDAIYECATSGKRATFMLPLWDETTTYNFMMTVIKEGNTLSALFIYFGDGTSFTNIDAMVADSFKDQLTGLFNRNTMRNHVSENRRDGYLVLFDLNKFKEINDNFGHAVGDEVLVLLAQYIISICTMDEVYYRRSGDEFMILSFVPDYAYTASLIEKLEAFLEGLHTGPLKQYPELRGSASFGVLELHYPRGEDIIGLENELKLTDLAMYQAKIAGERTHIITHKDALAILKEGNLDKRLKALAASIKR